MPWYLYIALRHLFPEGRKLTIFTSLSLMGVALGVSLLIVVISVFNGFGHEIKSKIKEISGDLRIDNRTILYEYDKLLGTVRADERVAAASPYAYGMAIMQYRNKPAYVAIQGIDVVSELEVVPIGNYLESGTVDDLDDDSVFLSSGIAYSLGVYAGDEIEVFTPLMLERLKRDQIILPRPLTIAGVYHTGWNDLDTNTVICTLRTMQDLYGLGEGAHAIKVRLKEGYDPLESSAYFNGILGDPNRSYSFLEENHEFLSILVFEKRMMFFLLSLVGLVAAFSVMIALLMMVIRKTREIGHFVAMGATPRQVAAGFCVQGFFIGVVGTILGFAFGFLLIAFRNGITRTIATITGAGDSVDDFYAFSYLPVHIELGDLAIIAILGVLLATLAGLLPAIKAARMRPVEALRSE